MNYSRFLLFYIFLMIIFLGCKTDTKDKLQDAPFYGKWCGPSHSGPEAPLDDLDTCCQTHDKCYEQSVQTLVNYLECTTETPKIACDRQFVQCLQALPADPNQWTNKPADNATALDYKDKAFAVFQTCLSIKDLFNK